jgi:hypothetical protein
MYGNGNSKYKKKEKDQQTTNFSDLSKLGTSSGTKYMNVREKNGQLKKQFSPLRKLNKSVDHGDLTIIVQKDNNIATSNDRSSQLREEFMEPGC